MNQERIRSANPDDVVGAVLARRGRARRLDALLRSNGRLDAEVVNGLHRAARDVLREDPRECVDRALLAEAAARRIEDLVGTLDALRLRAEAEIQRGEFGAAMEVLERARGVTVPGSAPEAAQRVHDDLGILRLQVLVQSDAEDAARDFARLLTTRFRRRGDRARVLRVKLALADLAFRRDAPREALAHYRAAVRSLPASASPRLTGLIAANRANALGARNRFRAADRQFAIAARVYGELGATHTSAQIAYNHAYVKGLRGDYRGALSDLVRLEKTFEELDDRRHVAHVLLDRAEMELQLNLAAAAAVHAGRAAEAFTALGMAKETAEARHLSGVVAALAGQDRCAAAHFRGAAAGFEELGLDERRARSLVAAMDALRQTSTEPALAELDRVVAGLLNAGSNPVTHAEFLCVRARVALDAGAPAAALGHLDACAERLLRVHAPAAWRECDRLRGRALRRIGDLEGAVNAYERATDRVESARAGVPPDQYMTAFLSAQATLFREMVDTLFEAGRHDEAFEYTERARARDLGDAIEAAGLVSDPREREGPYDRRLDNLRRRLNATYRRLFEEGDGDNLRRLRLDRRSRAEASDLEHQILDLLRRRSVGDDGRPAVRRSVSGLDEIRRRLDRQTCLLAYFFTETRLIAFVIERDRMTAVSRSHSPTDIQRHLGMLHFHLSKFTRGAAPPGDLVLRMTRDNLQRLAQIVLEPVLPWMRRKRVVVLPDGPLHFVPFHALPCGDGWAIDRFEITYAPSASLFVNDDRAPALAPHDGGTAVFGLPDERAPLISDEVAAVAACSGAERVYEQDAVTSRSLRDELRRSEVVHLATHGQFRADAPLLSSVRLADGWFAPHDLIGTCANARLVVLSACESGAADVSDGNEILGAARGFLAAGVGAVLCTQWQIDDAVTVRFMSVFHAALADGDSPASACRTAMDAVRLERPHPYYWAPFFLVGRSPRPALDAPAVSRGGRRGGRARDVHGKQVADAVSVGEGERS